MFILAILAIGVVGCFGGTTSAHQYPSDPKTDDPEVVTTTFQQYAGNTPQQGITIGVRPDGTGVVTVKYRLSLSTANETVAFKHLQANISANPAKYRTRFGRRMNRAVASAQVATGRQMAVRQLTVDATRKGTVGVVTYSFIWTNFATNSGGRLRVDDALTGFYLDDGQQLTITWPAEYELMQVRPSPDSHGTTSLRWNASTTFSEDEPHVELTLTNRSATKPTASTGMSSPTLSSANGPPSAGTNASNEERTDTPGDVSDTRGGSGTPASSGGHTRPSTNQLQILLVIVTIGAGLALLTSVLYRRHRNHEQNSQSSPDEPAIADPDSDSARETDEFVDSPDELLSNEERVMQVLERAGGRAKQQHVVEELGWTDAKTSQIVRNLRESGMIESFRLGRENVLSIPDDDTGSNDSSSE